MILPRLLTTVTLVAASVAGLTTADIPQNMTDDVASRSTTENVEDIVLEYIKALNLLPDDANVLYRRQSQSPPAADIAAAIIRRAALTTAVIPQSMTDGMASRSTTEKVEDIVMEYIKTLNVLPDDTNVLYRRQSQSSSAANNAAAINRRASPPAPGPSWNNSVITACTTALAMLRGLANSPTGMSMCYNLPFLDNSTGMFEADLRLFTIGPPTAAFAGVAPVDIAIDVVFAGAQVQPVPTADLVPNPQVAARRLPLSSPPSRRGLRGLFWKRADAAPVLTQSYAFVGQINRELQNANLNS